MDRNRIWPHAQREWIVHEDASLIIVDKPDGISTQSADPERADDIVTRLVRYKLESGEADAYFGVHQRLDRDTSGVILFTRSRAANPKIAAQFESRKVKKTYLACVRGWSHGTRKVTLRDTLVQGRDGKMAVAPKGRSRERGQQAVLHAQMIERRGDKAWIEIILETGRTHQARVQLAHAGAPIAGDALYGVEAASRLMLHARRIELDHPASGKKVGYESPLPFEFRRWLESRVEGGIPAPPATVYDDPKLLRAALDRAVRRRYGLGHDVTGPRKTTAFRLVNEDGDGLPRLAADVYGQHLVAQLYDDSIWNDEARKNRLVNALGNLGFDGVYLKLRPKQANVLVDTRREDLAPKEPVRGARANDEIVVSEEGVDFAVRLGDGLSTGIFLDQRANRRRIRELATEKRVANLFSYTCGFSIVAAVGGASRTVSVDASIAALERGRAGMRLLELIDGKGRTASANATNARHEFVADDVFRWLARAQRKNEQFDIVILDPPSYSSTKKRRFVGASDYGELVASALAIVAPHGILMACTNARAIRRNRFRKMIEEGLTFAKRTAAQMKDLPDPLDYPVAVGGESHLKSVLITLAD